MRKEVNRCTCESACEPFELNDKYKTIACRNCFEIISYEKISVKRTKMEIPRGSISDFINVLNQIRP